MHTCTRISLALCLLVGTDVGGFFLNPKAYKGPQIKRVCCSVLQCVAVCCSVLQCVALCCTVLHCVALCCNVLQNVAACCSVLQCVAVCCSALWCKPACCSVLLCVECVTVCCSVCIRDLISQEPYILPCMCDVTHSNDLTYSSVT